MELPPELWSRVRELAVSTPWTIDDKRRHGFAPGPLAVPSSLKAALAECLISAYHTKDGTQAFLGLVCDPWGTAHCRYHVFAHGQGYEVWNRRPAGKTVVHHVAC